MNLKRCSFKTWNVVFCDPSIARKHMKLVPKIILEGTCLTFKTETAFTLNEHPRVVGHRKYRYHAPLVSAEWCAFTPFPWGRGLINFNPDEAELAMETYRTWLRLFQLQRHYSWIVDRFHLSTKMFQLLYHQTTYDLDWLEEGLRELGFRLVFLHRNPDSFAEARAERLKVSGNPVQYDDLDRFVMEQQVMYRLFEHSSLEKITIDITGQTVTQTADQVADWMEATGGLYGTVR